MEFVSRLVPLNVASIGDSPIPCVIYLKGYIYLCLDIEALITVPRL